MNSDFKEFAFPDGKCSYHYINPCRNGMFKIPGGAEEENTHYFEGIVAYAPMTFLVEFCENEKKNSPTFFSFKVNVGTAEIIMSSSHGKKIQKTCALFTPGIDFILIISTKHKEYQVAINKNPPITYKVSDTSAITKAQYVVITGDVDIRSFHIHKNGPQTKTISLTIPGNAQVGDIFTFRGKGAKSGERIVIDFLNTDGILDDICFRFDSRFNYKQHNIIFNSYINKIWQKEQSGNGMPLKEEQPFKLDIVVEKDHFRCLINEHYYCIYKHILLFKNISKIRIFHDVNQRVMSGITSTVMTRLNRRTPFKLGYGPAKSIAASDHNSAIYFPTTPVEIDLPFTLNAGSCICISGVFKQAHKFEYVLKKKEGQVVYKLEADFDKRNLRYLPLHDGARVRTQRFPFRENGHFDMQMLWTHNKELCLTVDDVIMYRCQPYTDYNSANFICISGDVRIKTLAILTADFASEDDE